MAGAVVKPWVVVPCSADKRPEPEPMAAQMRYTGSLHRLAMDAATALTTLDRIRVVSAKYGLIHLGYLTEPYDRRMEQVVRNADDRRAWRSRVHCDAIGMLNDDLTALGLPLWTNAHYERMAPVIVLVPQTYADELEAASPLLERTLQRPLSGCSGIGKMRQRLAAIRDGVLSAPTQEAML